MLSLDTLNACVDTYRDKIATLDAGKVAGLDANLALDSGEHFEYQQTQARAHAEQVLSTDAAQLVYRALGEIGSPANGGWAAGTDTATKAVVTQLIGELLAARIKRARI